MLKLLGTATGENFESKVWEYNNLVWFVSDADIDSDGGSNPDGDKYWQADTSLHFENKPIDAETVSGIVVPAWLPKSVSGIVLGCQAQVIDLRTMAGYSAVVHDLGPLTKTGEITPHLAKQIGINPNSVNGGVDNPIFLFRIFPGVPAVVDGVTYKLQHI